MFHVDHSMAYVGHSMYTVFTGSTTEGSMKTYPHYIILDFNPRRAYVSRWNTPMWCGALQHVYSGPSGPCSEVLDNSLDFEPLEFDLIETESYSENTLLASALAIADDIMSFRLDRSTRFLTGSDALQDASEMSGIYRLLFRSGVSSDHPTMRVLDRAKSALVDHAVPFNDPEDWESVYWRVRAMLHQGARS